MVIADLSDYITAAPLAFTVGFFAGLAAASRYRIVKTNGTKSCAHDREEK